MFRLEYKWSDDEANGQTWRGSELVPDDMADRHVSMRNDLAATVPLPGKPGVRLQWRSVRVPERRWLLPRIGNQAGWRPDGA